MGMRAISAAIVLLAGVLLGCVCIATPFQHPEHRFLLGAPAFLLSIIGLGAWWIAFFRDVPPSRQPPDQE
jgi:hypothetical protein